MPPTAAAIAATAATPILIAVPSPFINPDSLLVEVEAVSSLVARVLTSPARSSARSHFPQGRRGGVQLVLHRAQYRRLLVQLDLSLLGRNAVRPIRLYLLLIGHRQGVDLLLLQADLAG